MFGVWEALWGNAIFGLLDLKFARCVLRVADDQQLERVNILRRRRLALPKYPVTDLIETHQMRVDDNSEDVLPAG